MTDHTEGGLCEDLGEDSYLQAKETGLRGKQPCKSVTLIRPPKLLCTLSACGPCYSSLGRLIQAHNHTASLETRILKPADSHVTARERGFPRPSSLEVYLRVRLTVSVLPHGSPDPEVDS